MISTTDPHAFYRGLDNFMSGMNFGILDGHTVFQAYCTENDGAYALKMIRFDGEDEVQAMFLIDTSEPGNIALSSVLRNMAHGQEGRENPYKFDSLPFGLVRWLSEKNLDFKKSTLTLFED